MEECFTVGEEELKVTYLRSVNGWIVDLGYTAGIERVPHSAGGRIGRTDCNFGAVCPPRLNARAIWRAAWETVILHCFVSSLKYRSRDGRAWICQNVWLIQLSSLWLNKP